MLHALVAAPKTCADIPLVWFLLNLTFIRASTTWWHTAWWWACGWKQQRQSDFSRASGMDPTCTRASATSWSSSSSSVTTAPSTAPARTAPASSASLAFTSTSPSHPHLRTEPHLREQTCRAATQWRCLASERAPAEGSSVRGTERWALATSESSHRPTLQKKLKEEAEKKKVEQLKAMGFPEEWAKDALKETKGDLDAAVEHLTLQLSAGDDFGSTPTASGGGGGGDVADASLVSQLTDMGFSADQAKMALQACVPPKQDNDVGRAVEFLFNQ
ncbi:UBA/TSN domain containing protein [Acanthamoeba castellanii str. Neff]|uniref:UBA/TSN domain containing protein n=1 Tax=Acanthamoeba castellanii (strain ATCC 30010 / Neff) TaxID=1257118 RepID=L8H4S4_ACACF|nr:UBA/TSN domain containing protein [Acanthamoeba castellanii str. Neff]ELR20217.1 UBA/TSN domain containing protein [Acanthamoeba castellanii str. Neff]